MAFRLWVPAFPTSLRQTLRRYLAGAGCLRLLRSLMLAAAACTGYAGAAGKRLAFQDAAWSPAKTTVGGSNRGNEVVRRTQNFSMGGEPPLGATLGNRNADFSDAWEHNVEFREWGRLPTGSGALSG